MTLQVHTELRHHRHLARGAVVVDANVVGSVAKRKLGTCKLTGLNGILVQSHLIPKAVTRPAVSGAPLIQSGRGSRPLVRWSSWYDGELVVEAGEKILSDLDNWAIPELRKHKLIWSGWQKGEAELNAADFKKIPGTEFGIRRIAGPDQQRLRLFFLSLLWRAAASQRFEMSEIELASDDFERLRGMVVSGAYEPLSFYPVTLIQIATLGEIHNHSPLARVKVTPAIGDVPERQVPFFRFYFDGLIAHFERPMPNGVPAKEMGSLFIGQEDTLTVTAVTYEESFQRKNLEILQAEAAVAEAMAISNQIDPPRSPGLPAPKKRGRRN